MISKTRIGPPTTREECDRLLATEFAELERVLDLHLATVGEGKNIVEVSTVPARMTELNLRVKRRRCDCCGTWQAPEREVRDLYQYWGRLAPREGTA